MNEKKINPVDRIQDKYDAFMKQTPKEQAAQVGNWLLDRAMIIIIIGLVIYIQFRESAFLQPASIINIISLTASRLPIALGIAGCIILTGTDLSAGRVMGLTGFISAIFLQSATANNKFLELIGPLPVPAVLLSVMLIGAIIGLINGFCIAKFKLHPFIVTLSTQLIVNGTYLALSNAKQIGSLDAAYTTNFVTNSLYQVGNNKIAFYVLFAVVLTMIMWVVWNKTTFGKNMFAVGSNEEAARVSGVNVSLVIMSVFALAGATYGYAGFVEVARVGSSTGTIGLNYELDAIAACVIGGVSFVGGIGKISGVILGVLLMQLIMSGMLFLGISGNLTFIIKGAVILIACAIDMRKYLTKK